MRLEGVLDEGVSQVVPVSQRHDGAEAEATLGVVDLEVAKPEAAVDAGEQFRASAAGGGRRFIGHLGDHLEAAGAILACKAMPENRLDLHPNAHDGVVGMGVVADGVRGEKGGEWTDDLVHADTLRPVMRHLLTHPKNRLIFF